MVNSDLNLMSPLPGRWLQLARTLWVILAVGMAVLWLASLPTFYQRVTSQMVPTNVTGASPVSNEFFQQQAAEAGLSLAGYVVYSTILKGFNLFVFYLLAGLIWWRLPNWFGWATASILLLAGSEAMTEAVFTAQFASWILTFGGFVWPFFFLWLYLFPNGRPAPRRLLWPIVILVFIFFLFFTLEFGALFSPSLESLTAQSWIQPAGPAMIALLLGIVSLAQVYRYRYNSNPIEKQQTKWFVFGLVFIFSSTIADFFFPFPHYSSSLIFLVLPITIAIGILRYRLWDIDVLIRRTLQYSLLTGLLALFYFGTIVVLQAVFRTLTGEGQREIVTVLSTLAIAALFTPLRRQVQRLIDRRFYRRKYDAAQTLAAFGTAARDEVDLNELTGRLLEAVEETMQPAHVSVWLRPAAMKDESLNRR
jgi:hypothetical protein